MADSSPPSPPDDSPRPAGPSSRPTAPLHLVLGGSGGIGSALCRRLVERGERVVVAGRSADASEALADELDMPSAQVDVTDAGQVDALVRDLLDEHGRLDGIAHCVGSIRLAPAHATTPEQWQEVLDLNLTSAFHVVRAAGKHLRKAPASVVLVSSAAARLGLPNHEAIAAAKAGVEALARSAAASYAPRGLRFNAVAPGLVDTPLSANITGNATALKASTAMHPLGRIGRPEDVASAIAWLLDPRHDWVTGQVLGVDGGLSTVRSRA